MRVKTTLIIVLFGLILAEIAMVYFSVVSSNTNKDNYKKTATNLAETVSLSLNKEQVKVIRNAVVQVYESDGTKPGRDKEGTPEFETYLAKFAPIKEMPEYKALQSYLVSVKKANEDSDGIYLAHVDLAAKRCVYIIYDEENEFFPVGMIDPLYEEDYPLVDNPSLGFVASIYTDEATGQVLVTAGKPVYDENNQIICYALADFTMATVRSRQASRIVRLFVYLMGTVALLSILGVLIINPLVIKPIKTLREAAMAYDVNDTKKTHEIFQNLDVKIHDEVADLADSMKTMENDIHAKINELTEANAALIASQKVAGKMAELANKDGLTGVRNKIAYDNQVTALNDRIGKGEEIEFGIAMVDLNYLKQINDEYGHNAGDRALIKVCNLICTVFSHSQVFRVGGDEFVVLLKARDYANSEALVSEFETRIDDLVKDEELKPYEQISAAIGYASYQKGTDQSVEEVYSRADKAMYARKKEMKGL